MEKYNYNEALANDIRNYITENEISAKDYESADEMREALNDDLWVEDSVTGNGSGSYFCNAWKAEEAICHNLDLLGEALAEFCCEGDYLAKNGAEAADVTIRCYLLGQILDEVISEDFAGAWDEE